MTAETLIERLEKEITNPDTSGAPYVNDPDLLAECLAEIKRFAGQFNESTGRPGKESKDGRESERVHQRQHAEDRGATERSAPPSEGGDACSGGGGGGEILRVPEGDVEVIRGAGAHDPQSSDLRCAHGVPVASRCKDCELDILRGTGTGFTPQSSKAVTIAELRELADCSPQRCHDAMLWAADEIERLRAIARPGDAAAFEEYAAARGVPFETESPQAPIAKITIDEDGMVQRTGLYAPGLPPGEHDLYCEPEAVAPYMRAPKADERRPTAANLFEDELAAADVKAAPGCWACGGLGYIDEPGNPCDCTAVPRPAVPKCDCGRWHCGICNPVDHP